MQVDPTAPGADTAGTIVAPVAIAIVVAAILLIAVLPRKYLLIPFFVVALFIPLEQRIVVAGLHFMMARILLIFAWARLLLTGSHRQRDGRKFRMNPLDKAFVLWVSFTVVTYIALWHNSDAIVNRMGFLYDALGSYFLFRFLCRDFNDADRAIQVIAALAVVIAACMINEQVTGRNLFAVFGGVPEITPIREGKLRSQGAFQHSILAGCFGATLLPVFISMCLRRKGTLMALAGVVACVIITLTSSSSTPLLACVAGIAALCMWPARKHMQVVRWSAVLVLLSLQMIMNAPVWALINKVSVIGGSSSWHRFELVDQFIHRFGEWWLVGTTTNAQWGLDTWDVANQYVAVGTRGGLITLVLFVLVIVRAFRFVGQARKAAEYDRRLERSIWALGAAVFANVAAFYGISYDGQTAVSWYFLLVTISVAASCAPQSASGHHGKTQREQLYEFWSGDRKPVTA